MRSYGRAITGQTVLKEEEETLEHAFLSAHTEERPLEDTAGRKPSTSHRQASPETILATP